jgi:hypothetical protein
MKIRDLGINFIPATMRPPEVGPGGGGNEDLGGITCGACTPLSPNCEPHSAAADEANQTCGACTPLSPNCEPHSACGEHSHSRRQAGSLTSAAAAQLRAQLRNQVQAELDQ